MIRKLTSLSRKTALILLVIIVAVAAGLFISGRNKGIQVTAGHPEYLNFGGKFVFTIPKSLNVDEQSVPGAELVYSTPLTAKTVDDVYNQNGIALQAISDLTNHSTKAFKDYVNKTFVPDVKKNLSTNDVKVRFGKANGSDNASITVKKSGQQVRFIFLKGGQHPVSVVAKNESDSFKTIEGTITDVEGSDLKSDSDSVKQAIQTNLQLAKAQKAQDLYTAAAPELRSNNTVGDLTNALKNASSFLNQNILVSGGSYNPNQFSAALRFTPIGNDSAQPSYGAVALKKISGQWKLTSLTLPTTK